MSAGIDGVLFGGQAKRVPAHRMEDVESAHALVTTENVGGGIAFGMAHVQAGAGRVGEHVEDVELRLGAVVRGGKGFVVEPVLLPLGLDDVEWVLFAEFGHNGADYIGNGKI